MALTKVSRGLLSTGIVDNSNATAITLNADESATFAGNVGIGTGSTTPAKKLVVQGTNHIATLLNTSDTANEYAQLLLQAGSSTNFIWTQNQNSTNYGGAHSLNIYTQQAGAIAFFTGGNNERMRLSSAGEVTMPYQPAFSAKPSSTQSDIVLGGVTAIFDTEIFDLGSNFASNTFTAPVTGKYQVTASVRLNNVDSAAAYYVLQIVTSNRSYSTIIDPDFGQDAVYWTQSLSVLADMDAGDTCLVSVIQNGGAAQTDIHSSTYSNFSGYLVA